MITEPTVLILGAGSSTHLGYPLGSDLIDKICDPRTRPSIDETPFDIAEVEAFISRLSRSGYYSIDAFLADVDEHLDIGKFLIARQLCMAERLDRLFPPYDSGWYRYLFNQMLVDRKPEFDKNNLSIVTFNYDRSLEAYLHTATVNRFGISSHEATERLSAIPIIHPHGILGDYPKTPYAQPSGIDDLCERAAGIRVIHELGSFNDEFCSKEFALANSYLSNAKRIYFLGFGFHPDNLERFAFFREDNLKDKQLKATTFRMGKLDFASLQQLLDSHGFPRNHIHLDYNTDCNHFFSKNATLE